MPSQIAAVVIFVAVFALASLRGVHLGVLMLPAACAVGVWLGGLALRDVLGGFPVGIMILLVGVTYFFGIAQVNGTIDRLIAVAVTRFGNRPAVLPFVFFALTGGVAAMGSPQAGLVLAPVGMPIARRSGVDGVLMAIAINAGISAGGLAPTSLFGIVSYSTARQANIDLNPITLFAVAVAANLMLVVAAALLFRRGRGQARSADEICVPGPIDSGGERLDRVRFDWRYAATLTAMAGLVVSVVGCALAGIDPDIGVFALAFGAALTLLDPAAGSLAVSKIDWSTVFMVGGIVTFVGVLQKMGAVDLLGQAAKQVGTPMVAALAICAISGLISAFASTTGILAALVPLTLPLVAAGGVAGWALICALAVCASIVDCSPFSTTGATLVASAAAEDRPRLTAWLLRWGLAMVVVGPVLMVGLLVFPSTPGPAGP